MYKIILLIILLNLTACQDLEDIVKSIAEENRVECAGLGFAGTPSSLYKQFNRLKRRASAETLFQLLEHDSLAVVAYASYAILDRKILPADQLFQRFLGDETNVLVFCGCSFGSSNLSSLIYHRYWGQFITYPDENDYSIQVVKDSRVLQKMDSLILYSADPDWLLLSRAFENRIYSKKYLAKIEQWAFEQLNFYALKYVFNHLRLAHEDQLGIALKKYLDEDDVHRTEKEEILEMLTVIHPKIL